MECGLGNEKLLRIESKNPVIKYVSKKTVASKDKPPHEGILHTLFFSDSGEWLSYVYDSGVN